MSLSYLEVLREGVLERDWVEGVQALVGESQREMDALDAAAALDRSAVGRVQADADLVHGVAAGALVRRAAGGGVHADGGAAAAGAARCVAQKKKKKKKKG